MLRSRAFDEPHFVRTVVSIAASILITILVLSDLNYCPVSEDASATGATVDWFFCVSVTPSSHTRVPSLAGVLKLSQMLWLHTVEFLILRTNSLQSGPTCAVVCPHTSPI